MLVLIAPALAFKPEPVHVLLQDKTDLFTNVEVSTGSFSRGSPLQVQFFRRRKA